MRPRKWIGVVALLGVLLHAGALVRHHGVMLGATLEHHALLSDLAQICHGAGAAAVTPATDLPAIPEPTDGQSGCPICSGLGLAFALIAPAPEPAAIALPQPAAPILYAYAVSDPGARYAVHPPARGPPALA